MLNPPSASPQNTGTLRCSNALELASGGKKSAGPEMSQKEKFSDLKGWLLSFSSYIFIYMYIYYI